MDSARCITASIFIVTLASDNVQVLNIDFIVDAEILNYFAVVCNYSDFFLLWSSFYFTLGDKVFLLHRN